MHSDSLQLLQLLEMNPYPDSYSVYKQLWEAGVVTREIAAVSLVCMMKVIAHYFGSEVTRLQTYSGLGFL